MLPMTCKALAISPSCLTHTVTILWTVDGGLRVCLSVCLSVSLLYLLSLSLSLYLALSLTERERERER